MTVVVVFTTMPTRRRTLLAGGSVALFGLAGCLSRLTGGNREFRPAVESYNRGVETFARAQSTRGTARSAYENERWSRAAERYVAARDSFDAAAAEFRTARDATSGSCPAVHDRAQRQYRRSLALVEACDNWTAAATTRQSGGGGGAGDADADADRARVWEGRAAEYPAAGRLDPDGFSCRR